MIGGAGRWAQSASRLEFGNFQQDKKQNLPWRWNVAWMCFIFSMLSTTWSTLNNYLQLLVSVPWNQQRTKKCSSHSQECFEQTCDINCWEQESILFVAVDRVTGFYLMLLKRVECQEDVEGRKNKCLMPLFVQSSRPALKVFSQVGPVWQHVFFFFLRNHSKEYIRHLKQTQHAEKSCQSVSLWHT